MQLLGLLYVSYDSPISPHSCLNIFIGFLLLPASSLRYLSSFADPTWESPLNTFVMPYVGLPQPPLFVHSVLLIVSTFLFLVWERLWPSPVPLSALALLCGINFRLWSELPYSLVVRLHPFAVSKLAFILEDFRTGSASDWCALREALYKSLNTIQYNTIFP